MSMRAVMSVATFVAVVLGPSAAAPAAAARPAQLARIVTLGDSYSSGSGLHRDAADFDDHGPPSHSFDPSTRLGSGACHREIDDTPGPRLATERGVTSLVVACAGAVIAEVPTQVAAAAIEHDGGGTLVTMTIGGNDIRTERGESWPDVLVRCITSSRCDRSDDNQVANFDAVQTDLAELYTRIGLQYPELSLRVLGYPRLMQSDRWCEGVTGVSRAEADWIDAQVDELDERIAAAVDSARQVTGADIGYVSVVDEFDNHGACRFWGRDRFVNDADLGRTLSRSMTADGTVHDHWNDGPLNISGSSFHPNRKGYDAFLQALRASIDATEPAR